MTLRLALLDIDGTLADSFHNIESAWTMACRACNVAPPPPSEMKRGIGLALVEAVALVMPQLSATQHVQVAEAYKEAFNVLRVRPDHREPLFPGTREMLAEVEAAGILLGVATGKSRRGLQTFLERHALAPTFITTHTADDGPGKPHPAMILAALSATGCAPESTAMVGDATFDMQMARAAGVKAIGVSWGNHSPAELYDAGAEVVIDDFAQLLPLLP